MHMHATRRTALRGTLALTFLFVVLGPAYAIGFHFSPANINVQARPGEVINTTFSLTLSADSQPTRFSAHIEDWWRSTDNNQTFFASPGTIKRSCGPWCAINPVEATVKPGETMSVRLSIRVPPDVMPGGYWAALTLDEVPNPLAPKPSGVAVTFTGSVSVGIFVEIPNATRAARITAVRVSGDKVSVTLRNEGNIPLRVNGKFEFRKPGEEKVITTVEIGGEVLLPEPFDTCEFSAALPSVEVLPSGRYNVRVIVDVGLDYLMGAQKEVDLKRPETSGGR